MGCCSSKSVDSNGSRIARWRSTGIVALRDSKLKTFPDEVLDLERSVRTVDFTHNKLVDIPMEISKLINLQRLILADNFIERLPMNLGKLQSLKVMILDGNRVTTLPDEVGQLVKLERLSISGNLLCDLPETIGSLRNKKRNPKFLIPKLQTSYCGQNKNKKKSSPDLLEKNKKKSSHNPKRQNPLVLKSRRKRREKEGREKRVTNKLIQRKKRLYMLKRGHTEICFF